MLRFLFMASMRPAHQAREVTAEIGAVPIVGGASMRPAHQAREVSVDLADFQHPPPASMRPAHQAREVMEKIIARWANRDGFNEARASSAGSNWDRSSAPGPRSSFNEARASSAGSKFAVIQGNVDILVASMRPAHQAREVSECRDIVYTY